MCNIVKWFLMNKNEVMWIIGFFIESGSFMFIVSDSFLESVVDI